MASSTQANFDAIKDADAHAQGLDGGLNLKTDSSRLAPPATTRADNASYLNPGNVAQLPAPASVMQANTSHVYNLHARDLQQPATQGDVMVHGEVLDMPGSSTNRFTTPCWSDGNGATLNTQQPCLPTSMRQRILTGRLSIAGSATTDLSNMMMARQEAGYSSSAPQRYALGYFTGAQLNVTFGLVDGLVETPETLTLALTADYVEIGGIQGTANWMIAALSGSSLTIYAYDFKGNLVSAASTETTSALSYNYLSSGTYHPIQIFNHLGRTFVGFVNNPSGSGDALYLWDFATRSVVATGITSASAPNYGFALASPYSHSVPTASTYFFTALYGNQVYVVAQTGAMAAGTVVGTSATLGLATKTGYDSSQSPTGIVNFSATMSCCAFDGVGVNTTASLGVTVFRHYPEQALQPNGNQGWYQAVSVDRISFQSNATTATNAGTITALGQNIFRTPSGVQLCSKAFTLQPGEALGAGLSAAKNAYVLVRCGGVEPYNGFSGNFNGNPQSYWWTYGQPTYFVIDHQARVVSRAFDKLGPVDASNNLTNNTVYRGGGNTSTAWGTAAQIRSLSAPLILAPNNDTSALDIVLPCWAQTTGTANLTQAYGTYVGVPNNLIMQPGAVALSLSAQGVSCPPAQGGPYSNLSGSLTCVHDGRGVVESNYHFRPHNPQVTLITTATAPGLGSNGLYQYVVVWEWYDSLGRVHRSEPSSPFGNTVPSGSYFNGATVNVPLPISAKSAVGGVMYARLYRSTMGNTSGIFYLVSTTAINALSSSTYFVTLTDASGSAGFNDPTGLQTVPYLAQQPRLYTATSGVNSATGNQVFASQAPPAFVFQCVAKGRVFGISINAQTPRLYYSSQIQDGFPFEWNANNYAPIPTDLGDVRSLEAIDDKIVLFGTRSIGAMNGDGPLGYAAASGSAVSAPTPNDGFSLIGPIPTPVGCLGSGAPARTPVGIVFQGYSGIQLVGRDLSVQPIGAAVDVLTGRQVGNPGMVFGRGVTLASMQAVVFTNASGPALVYNYLTQKWSTWPLLANANALVQRLDGVVQAGLQPVTNAQYAALANTAMPGCDVVQLGTVYSPLCRVLDAAGPGLVLESPWILPSGESGGESQLWDCTVTGSYIGPHVLQVEQAQDYSNTYVVSDRFNVTVAPNNYQYRVRPLRGARRIATRYRITLLPAVALSSNYLMATLGDLVLNYGSKQGTSRLGAANSG